MIPALGWSALAVLLLYLMLFVWGGVMTAIASQADGAMIATSGYLRAIDEGRESPRGMLA
ncbi:hypothetical protein P775_00120 [Puniceibacterium antarcticum]|uniref:Uncharacterized protein n=1 Tax=Puniceibacterium antarcticum TaxID=1206336 RepID=A0A2G8RL39_9RHOB|nr:hypothetical protein [Puniceibacterium antarcticum]PIL22269.1 hypothetical protein P775_00120 [Puniceibacterium antarcticum]